MLHCINESICSIVAIHRNSIFL